MVAHWVNLLVTGLLATFSVAYVCGQVVSYQGDIGVTWNPEQ